MVLMGWPLTNHSIYATLPRNSQYIRLDSNMQKLIEWYNRLSRGCNNVACGTRVFT